MCVSVWVSTCVFVLEWVHVCVCRSGYMFVCVWVGTRVCVGVGTCVLYRGGVPKKHTDRECFATNFEGRPYFFAVANSCRETPVYVTGSEKTALVALNAKFYRFSNTHHSGSPLATAFILALLAVQAFIQRLKRDYSSFMKWQRS